MSAAGGDPKGNAPSGDYHGVVHEYDGIIELDNQLPRWWLVTLFGAIALAAGYWLYYHSYQRADLPSAAYAKVKAAELAAEAEQLKLAGEVTPEMLTKLSHDPATVEQGKAVFAEICVTCHADGGRGNIGPNLTDDYCLHGGDPLSVYGTIRNGYLQKQMPAWGKTLGEERVRAVTAFVLTIQGSDVAGGKAPQGGKI